LDAIMAEDNRCRVACETLVTTGMAFIAGEITTSTYVEMPQIVRDTIRDIGYNSSKMGFDWQTCAVMTSIDHQSLDIAQGVNKGDGLYKEQGAGDQGLMFGYATDETPEFMPMPIMLAHKLCRRLSEVRKNGQVDFLRPDGKAQVTLEYEDGVPKRVDAVVIAAQHKPDVEQEAMQEALINSVVKKVIPAELMDADTRYYSNATGRFVIGGPMGDCGLTGRKIIVDTYGGQGSHGGGCFSGKDPSKVDRSASYMARHIAKNIVAAQLAKRCEVQIAYCIGVAQPVSINTESYGTACVPEDKIVELILRHFDMRPGAIIRDLNLRRPIYCQTAAYGAYGREDRDVPWERTDKAALLRQEAGL